MVSGAHEEGVEVQLAVWRGHGFSSVQDGVGAGVWQHKHVREEHRQQPDMCPQQRETGVHRAQRNGIERHGRQQKGAAGGSATRLRKPAIRRRAVTRGDSSITESRLW
ncbi:hypothetical protein StoSoilB3_13830 [Arthrobacter sp. StoSoilB3]|jgi:hypothetical protein|nr:hypothetical protein NtRootA2_13660 [Arthrobacter sp. NtRootA2]BCW14164.1 hypothetical protein NtRootA4_11430 [Arthrobacter sp. NtRootA4]BCW22500.1 hypothetical protein NtRootC7_13670 [Arthrobacter sp. NtRootC7]BCW26769.1 hypothetical protein NtRootC45_13690 [Arthrobacter sp. NtRootC45]BCW31039.1 hypothetical protein NtRootD5_13700 [Arthrobacter sp. NtRootD5]BCW39848.1 hypothetical protein StoSoilB3_13830 [Arthrobacter sp. StoSoilB3]